MPKWKKQTNLLRDAHTLEDRIEIIKTWADELSTDKLLSYMKSSFRTLNNPNRYKYYMQGDTLTHEKYLTFLICVKELSKRNKDKHYIQWMINKLEPASSKEWLTLYYIFKVYRVTEDDMVGFKLSVDSDEVDSLMLNAKTGGYEFKDMDYYDYVDMIKSCIKGIKKGTIHKDKPKVAYSVLLRENESLKEELRKIKDDKAKSKKHHKQDIMVVSDNKGSIIHEMEVRRSKPDKKRKLLDTW